MMHDHSPLQFNVIDKAGDLLCPCCGLAGQFNVPAYDERGGIIGRGICSACLWEPGFDDDENASAVALPTIFASLVAYRQEWIDNGCQWRGGTSHPFPENWSPTHTFATLFKLAPHLNGNALHASDTKNWRTELVAYLDTAIALAIDLRDAPHSPEDNKAMLDRTLSMLEDTKGRALSGELEPPNGVRKLSMSRQVSDYIYDLNCPLALAVAAADRYYLKIAP